MSDPSLLSLAARARWNEIGSPARVERFRDRCLRRLVRHAYAQVPYYRERFDSAGLDPRDIRTAADLGALPASSKEELRDRPLRDLLAHGVGAETLVPARTSGTTGIPFAIYRSARERAAQRVFHERALRAYGGGARDHVMVVSRPRGTGSPWLLRAAQRVGLYRRSGFDMLRPPEEIAAELRRARPDVIVGIAAVLLEVARVLEEDGGPPVRPRLVMTSGELETPLMKRRLEEAFACPARNQYAAEEMCGVGAWECPRGGTYHVHDDGVLIELEGDDALPAPEASEEVCGEVVVTALHVASMPVLRWSLGDLARRRAGGCACGSPFSTLEAIEGRRADFFRLPGGRGLFSAKLFHAAGAHHDWMAQIQLEQVSLARIVARVVPSRTPSAGAPESVAAAMQSVLGPGVELRLELVEKIAPAPGGKTCSFWSRLDPWHEEPARDRSRVGSSS